MLVSVVCSDDCSRAYKKSNRRLVEWKGLGMKFSTGQFPQLTAGGRYTRNLHVSIVGVWNVYVSIVFFLEAASQIFFD